MKHYLGLHLLSLLTTASARSGSDLKAVMVSLDFGVHTGEGKTPMLPLCVLVSLLEQLEIRASTGRFVFALADVFNFDAMPAVSAFLASAQNLRQLQQVLEWIPVLVHPDMMFDVHDQATTVSLHPRVVSDDPRLSDHPLLIELMMATVVRIIHQVAPDVRNINRIDLKHAAQCEPSVYQAYFHCPVNFQAERNTMYGDNQLLDGVLPGSLPQAHTSAEATIRRHLLGDGLSPPLAMQAAMLLRQRIALLSEGLEGLAKHLHLHPRALQRELSKAGTSYSALVAHIRHDQASAMLRDTVLDIDSIALKLGFSERRSFTLAFRQWQGCTPSDYRRSIRTQATTGHISTTGIFH